MQSISDSMYHKVLRVSVVVCAFVLLFESGLLHQSTIVLSENTHRYVANAVGMTVSVAPTELNTMTAELTKQRLALEAREQAIAEREIDIGLAPGDSPNQKTIYLLSGVLFTLLVLIVLNYVLDYIRFKEQSRQQIA